MKVIAYKKTGLGVLYTLCSLVLAFCIILLFLEKDIETVILFIFSLALMIIFLVVIIQFYRLPNEMIKYDEEQKILYLPKNLTIPLSEVNYVTYNCAHARGLTYKWGAVTIHLNNGKSYKLSYVANCEEVAVSLSLLLKNN